MADNLPARREPGITAGDSARLPAGTLVSPTGIMVIAEVPAGVRLYASRDIPAARFWMEELDHRPEWQIDSLMRAMLVITRPTLGECLAELARIWGNQDREREAYRLSGPDRSGITS